MKVSAGMHALVSVWKHMAVNYDTFSFTLCPSFPTNTTVFSASCKYTDIFCICCWWSSRTELDINWSPGRYLRWNLFYHINTMFSTLLLHGGPQHMLVLGLWFYILSCSPWTMPNASLSFLLPCSVLCISSHYPPHTMHFQFPGLLFLLQSLSSQH